VRDGLSLPLPAQRSGAGRGWGEGQPHALLLQQRFRATGTPVHKTVIAICRELVATALDSGRIALSSCSAGQPRDRQRMIPKSVKRLSEKIMRKTKELEELT
jgi:hypothetical protein